MPKKENAIKGKAKYTAPALEKGLDILEYISLKAKPLSQSEIALGINRSPNEIYRMLIILEHRGYILRDEISGKYRLSLRLYSLSHRHSPIDELRKGAQYPMDDLSEKTRQSCHLSVLYRNKLIIVSQSRSPGSIALSIEEGSVFPLMETASGKVLLAFMPGKEQMEILNRNKIFNSFNKEDKKEYLQILKDIENDGYYFASSEQADGVTDITVPIGNDKDIIASLTVSILSMQLKEKILHKEILKKTLDTANKISKNLGFK
ncbi:MAG TPA: IclR family transcriptional regulator [Chitinophagaceae bacterium]|nr:IclR family transcriptional regulator [Chitinophagaceae bacterium]